ncbi:hypothetical protein ACSCBZ_18245 [Streptomyces niveiscabiei]|uniref:hypothetical protein n=1 Tax=Streptomyces TaxID=1883 RepID=UPI001403A9A0|nr:hypothetical protein [Streptomyces sp. V2]
MAAGAGVDFAGTDLFAVGGGLFTAPDHDRVTDAGRQAAAASRTSMRPPPP